MLCDDVLSMIFEDQCITSAQLGEIGNVCTRFNRIAMKVFKKKYKGGLVLATELQNHRELWLLEEYLSKVGPWITTLEAWKNDNIRFAWLLKYCTNIVSFKGDLCQDLQDACNFPKLRQLHLDIKSSNALAVETFFTANAQLESVKMHADSLNFNMVPFMSQLKSLSLTFKWCNRQFLGQFEWMTPLKSLRFIESSMDDVICILNGIAKGNVQLESLNVFCTKGTESDISCFKRLKSLKSLRLSLLNKRTEQIIESLANEPDMQLERVSLFLYSHNDNKWITNSICRMSSITNLSIHGIDEADMLRIFQEMDQLIEIIIFGELFPIRAFRNALEDLKNLRKVHVNIKLMFNEPFNASDWNDIDKLRQDNSIELLLHVGFVAGSPVVRFYLTILPYNYVAADFANV